jgi:hypothetical protein
VEDVAAPDRREAAGPYVANNLPGHVSPPSTLFRSARFAPTAYMVSAFTRSRPSSADGTRASACVHETPPSDVRWMLLDAPAAKQVRSAVQRMSFAPPGTGVRREKLRPPSAVQSTRPSVSSR